MLLAVIFYAICLSGSIWLLQNLIFTNQHSKDFDSAEYFAESGLPATGLERYRLLQEEPDGPALEQVKEAARKKVAGRSPPKQKRLLILAGYESKLEQHLLLKRYVQSAIAVSILMLLSAFVVSLKAAIVFSATSILATIFLQVQSLQRKARQVELHYLQSMASLFESFRKALMEGTDLATTLRGILRSNPLDRESDPVLITFALALESSKKGTDIGTCLKRACADTGVSHLGQLAGLLSLCEQQGAGWQKPLSELKDAVGRELRCERSRPVSNLEKLFNYLKN